MILLTDPHSKIIKSRQNFDEKPLGKSSLGRPNSRKEDNNKIDLTESFGG
jgi:hypothetical protein